MSIELEHPDADGLDEVVEALRQWQDDAAPFGLHPGDVGWLGRFGAAAAADVVRAWRRDGRLVAAGELDGHELLRLGVAPDVQHDQALARQIAADLSDPGRGVLQEGTVYLEVPSGAVLRDLLEAQGWGRDASWTPLRRDLAAPVDVPGGLRVEVVGPDRPDRPDRVDDVTTVLHGAFERSTFSAERWRDLTAGPAFADARCLVGYDDRGAAVATVTVWSAGPGRPGLLEPMGVHRDHRGHGHGRAITLAAAAALREMGSSSATVCTPTSNVGGVATYRAAGYEELAARHDLRRDG